MKQLVKKNLFFCEVVSLFAWCALVLLAILAENVVIATVQNNLEVEIAGNQSAIFELVYQLGNFKMFHPKFLTYAIKGP